MHSVRGVAFVGLFWMGSRGLRGGGKCSIDKNGIGVIGAMKKEKTGNTHATEKKIIRKSNRGRCGRDNKVEGRK